MKNQQEPSVEEFKQAILHRRLLYLWGLRFLGYQVNDKEIEELEGEIYPDIPKADNEGNGLLCQRDIDELQLILSFSESQPEQNREAIKARLFKLKNITIRMRQEQNHARPHFHIEYKNQYSASYAIDTFERLAGNVPTKYEKPMLEWAARHRNSLLLTWSKMQAGENVQG
jgi:hypothetical protein